MTGASPPPPSGLPRLAGPRRRLSPSGLWGGGVMIAAGSPGPGPGASNTAREGWLRFGPPGDPESWVWFPPPIVDRKAFELVPKSKRTQECGSLFRAAVNENGAYSHRTYCGTWSCPGCAKYMVAEELRCAWDALSSVNGQIAVYQFTVPSSREDRRRQADRWRQRRRRYAERHNRPVECRSYERVVRLPRPSEGWSRPKRRRSTPSVELAKCTEAEVDGLLRMLEDLVSEKSDEPWASEWPLPTGWTPDDVAALVPEARERLAGGAPWS